MTPPPMRQVSKGWTFRETTIPGSLTEPREAGAVVAAALGVRHDGSFDCDGELEFPFQGFSTEDGRDFHLPDDVCLRLAGLLAPGGRP